MKRYLPRFSARETLLIIPVCCDIAYSVLVATIGMWLAGDSCKDYVKENWGSGDRRSHLGAEYDSIAKAIRRGRGFSDPFRTESGPTAWVPPVLPYLLASAYWGFEDNREKVVSLFVVLQGIAVGVMVLQIVRHARQLQVYSYSLLLIPVFLATNFHELFQKTHDTSIILLLVCLIWHVFPKVWNSPNRLQIHIGWGILGGLTALCSPILGAAWATLTLMKWRSRVGITAVIAILVISPWVLRNKVVFGCWIPIKSNAGFELWQSHEDTPFGVLNDLTLAKHPYGSNDGHLRRYLEVGEMRFVAEKRKAAIAAILDDPLRFLSRCTNRLLAATIVYFPYSESNPKIGGGWPLFLKRIVYPLPIACLLITTALKHRITPELGTAVGILLLYLLPYIFISFYDRYATPVLGMKIIIMLTLVSASFRRPAKRLTM